MKTTLFRSLRRVSAALVIIFLVAGCADTALAQDPSAPAKGATRMPAAAAPSRSNGGSGGQSGSNRQVSVPVVSVARQGQSGRGGNGGAGGGITGVTRVTRMSENNQNVRDFFRSSGLRLP